MASVFLEQWHLFFPKVSAVWRHFLIFLHARVSISQLSPPLLLFTAFFSFTSLSFPVPSGSSLSHYLSVSLFLSFPFLSWEASKILTFADALHYNLSFLSQSRLLYIVPQKHWSAIHDQNLSRSTWGIWSLSDSSWMQNTAIEVILHCIAELQRSFTWINPLHVFAHWRFNIQWKACV